MVNRWQRIVRVGDPELVLDPTTTTFTKTRTVLSSAADEAPLYCNENAISGWCRGHHDVL